MDGVLVDSEPFWRRVEIEIFAAEGVHLTEKECEATMGLRTDDVVRFRLPGRSDAVLRAVEERLLGRMVEVIRAEGTPMPGAIEAIDFVRARGLRLALASSSPERLIA